MILWMCHPGPLIILNLKKNSSPIVLIEITTIVLKEGRSETLKPPVIFGIT